MSTLAVLVVLWKRRVPVAIRVGINGFGRIGRLVFRNLMARKNEFDVVAVNDLTDNRTLAHAPQVRQHATAATPGTVDYNDNELIVDGKHIKALAIRDPATLPWGEMNVDVVVESTGIFTARETNKDGKFKPGYDTHLKAGAKRVVLSAPAKDGADLTCVLGVNDDKLNASLKCISNASCTTNCPGSAGQGAARKVRHSQGSDDHRACLYERSALAGSAAR